MGAESGAVKSAGAGRGREHGRRSFSRGTRSEWWSAWILKSLPRESLLQAADLYVEEAWFEDGLIFCVDERQILFG